VRTESVSHRVHRGVHGVNRDLVRVPNIAKGVTLGWGAPDKYKGRASCARRFVLRKLTIAELSAISFP